MPFWGRIQAESKYRHLGGLCVGGEAFLFIPCYYCSFSCFSELLYTLTAGRRNSSAMTLF